MTLIVEIGTAAANSESYISVAEATSYHAKIGNTAWDDLDTDVQEQSLRLATEYMLSAYGTKWAGSRVSADQVLDWPRTLVPRKDLASNQFYASNIVPLKVRQACALLALRATTGKLLVDQGQRKVSVTIGPISTTYDVNSSAAVRYSEVDLMLAPFFKHSSGQIRMVRQ